MSPSADDDFEFDDLVSLDLDLDEKAMLAGIDSSNSNGLRQSTVTTRNTLQLNPEQLNRFAPTKAPNSSPFNHNVHNSSATIQTKPANVARDEFEDFGDIADTDLFDNDLFEESASSSSSSRPTNFFNVNSLHQKSVEQQNFQQRFQQQQAPKPAPAPQPTKFFSIFSGANNQIANKSNAPRNANSTSFSNSNNSNNNINSNNARVNSFQRQGSNNNIAPIFQKSVSNNTTVQQAPSLFTSHQPFNNQSASIIPRSDPSNDFATDIFKSPELPTQPSQPPTHHEIDREAALTWQYPINYPKRDYQYNIIRRALFSNTLVSLPTGLGKTFIAAVVMLNYFRWFPKSKIIFMAPTRPLVNQQIEACFNICGISQEETVEMTGQQNSELRKEMWLEKRVIYCTPQVLQNDIKSGICPAEDIVCLVVDEAHRAVGRYAYSEVIRLLEPINQDIRIMALTATPGGDIKTVQKVVQNLKIAKIEMRTEDSMDLQRYIFKRTVQEMVIPCGREVGDIRDKFVKMIRPMLDRLCKLNVLRTADPAQLSRFIILQGRDAYIAEHPQHSATKSFVMKQVGITMGLVHAYELLTIHGIRPFYANMDPFSNNNSSNSSTGNQTGAKGVGVKRKYGDNDADKDDDNKPSLARKAMEEIPDFMRMMDSIRIKMKNPGFCSHPKIERLVGIVIQHFTDHQDQNDAIVKARTDSAESSITDTDGVDHTLPQTRIMIFANYRESVEEIGRVLELYRPLVKVQSFIGQATAKGKKGISQKEQQKVVADFQKGEHNVLVATSIGEEGLDIGDVDLIICYDSHSSPIRMLQRMGRTGRKRKGRICLLLAEGQEEQKYRRSQTSYKTVQRAIAQGNHIQYYPYSPRILPPGAPPTCDLVHIEVPTYITPSTARKRRKVGDDSGSSGIGTKSVNQNAFLDAQEMARFQQFYRVPKRQVIALTFRSACKELLKNRKTTVMKPDKTFIIGHSARTMDFINTTKRIAKARIDQSLGEISGTSVQKDSHSTKMLALIDRWGPTGTGAEESMSDVFSTTKGKDSTGGKKSNVPKKGSLYSLEGLSDDEMEEFHSRVRSRTGANTTSRHHRMLIDESEDEDDDSASSDHTPGQDSQLSAALFRTSKTNKIQPKPKRKNQTSKLTAFLSASSRASRLVDYLPSPSTKSIQSLLPTLSDDEVDMEIMGGLGEVFEQTVNDDYDYENYVPDTTSIYKEHEAIPKSAGPISDSRSKDRSAEAWEGFDFQESIVPLLWYKSDYRNSKDQYKDVSQDSVPRDETSSIPFVLFELPQVPEPGQWYKPQNSSPVAPFDHEQMDNDKLLDTLDERSDTGGKAKDGFKVEQEILVIESSEDEGQDTEIQTTKSHRVVQQSSTATIGRAFSYTSSSSLSNNANMGFVSARSIPLAGTSSTNGKKSDNFGRDNNFSTKYSGYLKDSHNSNNNDNNGEGDGGGDSYEMDDFDLEELDLAYDDSLLEEDTPW
ncbi:hypothetical protein BGZ46_009919 [Entomortierella lignicola]|nr:hypothetical protein BGZ46_009919 [Entomortierella lignicola]